MTNTDKTLSTERLEELAKGYETWGKTNSAQPQIDLDTASALRELLASRTQEPAEPVIYVNQRDLDRLPLGGEHHIQVRKAPAIGSFATPLYLTPPAPERSKEEVRIKPLVWGKTSYGRPEVETIIGVYRVFEHINGGWAATFKTFNLVDAHGRKNFATEEDAIAAVEADYERRIRSALEPASLHKGEAVAWQARKDGWPEGYWSNPTQLAHSPVVDFGEGWSTRLLYASPAPLPVGVTDEVVKRASVEYLLHKGEQPMRVTRRGAELWEDYAPAIRAAITAALSKPGEQG